MIRVRIALAIVCGLSLPAAAGPARCYNTDDGNYACNFEQHGGDGSFTIAAPARPTYTIEIVGRDIADAFADFGSGSTFLPGPFRRSQQDRACWVSDATGFAICAD